MARKSTSKRCLRYPDIPDSVARADRRGDLSALSADLRGLSAKAANAATRMDRIDRTKSGLSATAHGLAGCLAELRAESPRSGAYPNISRMTLAQSSGASSRSMWDTPRMGI